MPRSADSRTATKLMQAEFGPRFREALDGLGVKRRLVATFLGVDPTTLSRMQNPDYPYGPPSTPELHAIEEFLGLPRGYFEERRVLDLVAMRVARGQREVIKDQGSKGKTMAVRETMVVLDTGVLLPAAWVRTKDMIAEQLAGYERRNAEVPPSQVGYWLAELERAVRSISAVGDAAQTEAEHVGRHRQQAQKDVEAASPPRGRAARRSAPG